MAKLWVKVPMNIIGMAFWEHDRLNRPDLWKRIVLSGILYAAPLGY